MRRTMFLAWVLAAGLVLTEVSGQDSRSGTPLAFRFDPVFRIARVSGDVFVLRPGEKPTIDIETGREILPPVRDMRAYPYGTRIVSSTNGTGDVRFSRRQSEMTFGRRVEMVVDEDKEDARHKIVHLNAGRVAVSLQEGIEENSNAVTVKTPGAFCAATNMSAFSVNVTQDEDKTLTDILASDGALRVYHPDLFEMNLIAIEKGRERGVRVISSPDGNFVDLRGMQGTFGVKVRDPKDPDDIAADELGMMGGLGGGGFQELGGGLLAEEQELFEGLPHEEGYRIFKMTPDFNIKFSKRRIPRTDTLLVTILTITADGEIRDEITYKEGAPPPPPLVADADEADPFGVALPEIEPAPGAPAKEEAVQEIDLGDFGFGDL